MIFKNTIYLVFGRAGGAIKVGLKVTFGHISLVSYLMWEESSPEDPLSMLGVTLTRFHCVQLADSTYFLGLMPRLGGNCQVWDWLAHMRPAFP